MQHRSHARDREVRLDVLLVVPAQRPDAIAGHDPERAQRPGQAVDPLRHLGVAGVPGPLALERDDLAVRIHLRAVAEELRDAQRRVLHGRVHGLHSPLHVLALTRRQSRRLPGRRDRTWHPAPLCSIRAGLLLRYPRCTWQSTHAGSMTGAERMLATARREPADRTPIWFMRQAGRCLAGYRALRETYDILTITRTPELCAQVTLMPVEEFGVDAAVMYADIMLPLIGHGRSILDRPRHRADHPCSRCAPPPTSRRSASSIPREATPELFEAIRLVRRELDGTTAVVGFAGGPVHRRVVHDRGQAHQGVLAHQGDAPRRAASSGTASWRP